MILLSRGRVWRLQMTLEDDEARLLIRAATAGLKGSQPVMQDAATARTLFDKLMHLASQIMED